MRTSVLIASLAAALATSLTLSFPVAADTVKLREDAPDRYVVVKGDTLWDISAKFLKTPWLWPELWQLNKEQISNPHLIYPGDVLFLTMTASGPRLSRMGTVRLRPSGMEAVKLSPSIHTEAIPREEAIPTLPYAAVKGFLHRPLVSDEATLSGAPTLIGSEDGRVMVTTGDRVYASAIDPETRKWHIVRLGKRLIDPDTDKEIARELEYIGDASTLVAGAPGTLAVDYAEHEVLSRDRLIPAFQESTLDFVPHAPQTRVEGRIISAYGGTQASGKNYTVVINRGKADGIEVGHVLAAFREGRTLGRGPDEGRFDSYDPKSGFLTAAKERESKVEYKDLGEELTDFVDPFDMFFKPFPDGRRGWRYLDYKCLKPDAEVSAGRFHDPAEETGECVEGDKKSGIKWAYVDIGCLKPGKQVRFGDVFDPKDVYEPHCRPSVVKLPDARTGLVMVYRVFDRVSYALVMDSPRPLYLLDIVRNP